MAQPTAADRLETCLPTTLPNALKAVKINEIVAGLIPRLVTYTGLTSQAAHILTSPGPVLSVNTSAHANLVPIHSGAVGAGEVLVEYDADGLATLTFEGAVTGFSVVQQVIPADLATLLTTEI